MVALQDVSFQVKKGEIVAVIGPNGAGKSTLFRILTGLTSPTQGRAEVLGFDTIRQSLAVRRVVGFTPADDRSLWLRHTCRENLRFHARLQGMPDRSIENRVDEMLETVGLATAADRVGFALSSGMRARLQLARALLHNPSVLILDEPTGSVDPVGSHELLELIKAVTVQRGLAVLISSHRVEEIDSLHENVVMLDRGHLVYWGDLDSLRYLWSGTHLEIVFAGEREAVRVAERMRAVSGVELLIVEPPNVTLTSQMGVGELLALLDGELQAVKTLRDSPISLREILSRAAHMEQPTVIAPQTR